MSVGPTCPDCGWIHPSNAARASGGMVGGPSVYRADIPDAPTRATRAEAECDWCEHKRARDRQPWRMAGRVIPCMPGPVPRW